MRSIWHTQKKKFGSLELFISVLLFFAMLVWLNIGLNSVISSSSREDLAKATDTVKKAVILCYSIEGAYPPDIAYLEEHYGINIDDERYSVHYSVFSSNLMPDIYIFPK